MNNVTITRNQICKAIEKATDNLKPGTFVDKITKKEFSKHCSVCAVGAIFQQTPKLNTFIEQKALKNVDSYNKDFRACTMPKDVFIDCFEDEVAGLIGSHCLGNTTSLGNSVEEDIEMELGRENYLSALSIYFESFLNKYDSKELKSASLQNFVLLFFPKSITINLDGSCRDSNYFL